MGYSKGTGVSPGFHITPTTMTKAAALAESVRRCEFAPEQSYILSILATADGHRFFGCYGNLESAAQELMAEGLIQVGPAKTNLRGQSVFKACLAA